MEINKETIYLIEYSEEELKNLVSFIEANLGSDDKIIYIYEQMKKTLEIE